MTRPSSLPSSVPWGQSARLASEELAFQFCELRVSDALAEEEEDCPEREEFMKWWHNLFLLGGTLDPHSISDEYRGELEGCQAVIASRGADFGDYSDNYAILFADSHEAEKLFQELMSRAERRATRASSRCRDAGG